VLLGLAIVGVVVLIFDVVLGGPAATIAGVVTAVTLFGLWVVLPLVIRERQSDPEQAKGAGS